MGPVVTKCKSKRKIDLNENSSSHLTNIKSKSIKLTHINHCEESLNIAPTTVASTSMVPSESLAVLNEINVKSKTSIFESLQAQENACSKNSGTKIPLSVSILSKKTSTTAIESAQPKVKKYKLVKSMENSEKSLATEPFTVNCEKKEKTREEAKLYLIKVLRSYIVQRFI